MSPVFTRTVALPRATLVFAVACSGGDGPTQPVRTSTGASTAKQSTTSSQITNTPAVSEFDPSYSPNGKQIAFASQQIAGNVLNTISVMLVNGTAVTRLSWSTTDGFGLPKWSPDGKRIAFTLMANGGFSSDIHVMNVDGTGVTNLTNSPAVTEQLTAWAR